jgi:hypothetical protein
MKLLSLSKYLMSATVAISLSFGSAGALAHGGEDHDDKPAELKLSAQGKRIVSMLGKYATAVETQNLGDLESFVITDNNFTSFEGTYPDVGWKSYRKHLTDEWPMFNDTVYHLSNIRPYVKGKMAYATMDYKMNTTIKSDQFEGGNHELEMIGVITMVMVKSGQDWKIRHIHTARKKMDAPGSEGKKAASH